MIGLSLAILLFRLFKAHGAFLGRVTIRTVHSTKDSHPDSDPDSDSRACFLPLDRRDGSNPNIPLERPYPGIFIYRFTEGFNFPNANHHLDYMVSVITAETRPTTVTTFTKPGDRPWNDAAPRHAGDEEALDDRPTLKAVVLDFSAVNNLDLTSVHALLDVRVQLDRRAAPRAVQWHFASVQNRWAKRALAAVGFGLPSLQSEDGHPHVFRPVYSLAEMESADESFAPDTARDLAAAGGKGRGEAPKVGGVLDDIEMMGDLTTQSEKIGEVERVETRGERDGNAERLDAREARLAALHGINRPFFHPDVQSALASAIATERLYEAIGGEK